MSAPRAAPPEDAYLGAKRRKVRKGTHSCWECKRRKMKCRFDPGIVSDSCNGCRRRGSRCIGQEFPEDLSYVAESTGSLGNSTSLSPSGGTESVKTPSGNDGTGHNIPTPASLDLYPASCKLSEEYLTTKNDTGLSQYKYERLSQLLHESLPSREDTESICKASCHSSILSHELLTTPYTTLYQSGLKTPKSFLSVPEPNVHPVLIARYMLQLAIFLQHLHPDLHKDIEGLSAPPRAIMERLVDTAIRHITTNDEFLGSIEHLECIMLESLYQVNRGNLRRSWVTGRRAMSAAQLMGVHRSDSRMLSKVLDPNTKYNPQLMWLRIVILDRYLCLLLGLSQGSIDHSMASEACVANDCPMGRLERLHCVIMSRILERNETKLSAQDLTTTRAIDLELQKAARSLPGKWWLAPKLHVAPTDLQELFWDTRRLVAQICHYNLLNQLHLPYMLHSTASDGKYEYSRITCVNASREVLSRYITLRSFNRIAYSCRTVDFLALMAAMALLLAHMDGHRDGVDNLLANQYMGDRGMIEQVQENMGEINRLNSDALSAQSADLLKALLAIDMETGGRRVSVRGTESEGAVQQDGVGLEDEGEGVVRMHIPYFGIIRISREVPAGFQAVEPRADHGTPLPPADRIRPTAIIGNSETLNPSKCGTPYRPLASAALSHNTMSFQPIDTSAPHESTAPLSHQHQEQEQYQHMFSDAGLSLTRSPLPQSVFPEVAAGCEDWAFQGVDMAFFEGLMRSVGGDV